MICLQWCRVTTVGIYLLAFLVLLTESTKNTSSKKELIIRNKREGSWSAWSRWSPCSRTCGGGIRTQTRYCRIMRSREKSKEFIDEFKLWKNASSRHCEGQSSRSHLCNSQDCPQGTVGIRESQCKTFDNRPFMGKVYQWEAFIDERAPCSLTCRAIGFRFFTTLNKSVIDGTPCQQPVGDGERSSWFDLQVCISGSCTSIGCDGIAGSQRRLDRCGVCGGDNSTCRVVSGIFTRAQLPVGYNMVAHIPRGACNLNITQIRKSPNYLALRKYDGSYILNGNWAISWPGEYAAAGATFHYKRQDLKSFESIAASGPLHEPIDLLVLYQQPNPGIKYEYMMPMNDAPIPPAPGIPDAGILVNQNQHRQQSAATSRPSAFFPSNLGANNDSPANLLLTNNKNSINTISSFPQTPGQNGIPGDSSYSQKHHLQPETHPHLHGHQGRRSGHGNNKLSGGPISDKKFQWKMTGYTNCTEPCGGGTQTSIVRCIRVTTGAPVPDRRCHGEDKSPIQTTIRCNLKPCPAEWTVGPWSDCTEICGDGFQTRTVHCQQRVSPTLTMRVLEGACLESQPESRKSCFNKLCHRWETTTWSQCSAPCGNGIRNRNIMCLNSEGNNISEVECDSKDKPLEISPCNMSPCEGADWFVSIWSNECSEKCGSGLQTRHVVCSGLHEKSRRRSERVSSEIETNLVDDDDENFLEGKEESSLCDEGQKPAEEKECFSERQCAEAAWFAGPWSECLVSCGNGLQTRQVLCVLFSRGKFKVVDDSLCSRFGKPDEKSRCESPRVCPPRWFTTEWTECSAPCGGGVQKRSISCRNSNWTAPSSKCFDSDRPLDRQSCNEHKCDQKEDSPVNLQLENRSTRQPTRAATSNPQAATKVETSHSLQEPNEEPDDTECTDQYRNCALVVQARLCRYKYYAVSCCLSCSVN